MQTSACGELPIGIEYGGRVHREFEVRLGKISDAIEVEKNLPTASPIESSMAMIARRIVRLGTIPREAIDHKLLMSAYDLDIEEINRVYDELQKKIRLGKGATLDSKS